jgi:hypothetical protein
MIDYININIPNQADANVCLTMVTGLIQGQDSATCECFFEIDQDDANMLFNCFVDPTDDMPLVDGWSLCQPSRGYKFCLFTYYYSLKILSEQIRKLVFNLSFSLKIDHFRVKFNTQKKHFPPAIILTSVKTIGFNIF